MLQKCSILALFAFSNVEALSALLYEYSSNCTGTWTPAAADYGQCSEREPRGYSSTRAMRAQTSAIRVSAYSYQGNVNCATFIGRGTTADDCVDSGDVLQAITSVILTMAMEPKMEDNDSAYQVSEDVEYGLFDGNIVYELVRGSENTQRFGQLGNEQERINFIMKFADRKKHNIELKSGSQSQLEL